MSAQKCYGRERLQRWNIARAGHDDIGISAIVAGPLPDTRAGGAVSRSLLYVEPLPFGLFARDDQVDVVATAQAMIGDRQQAIRVRRQINAHDVRFLVRDVIDEAW